MNLYRFVSPCLLLSISIFLSSCSLFYTQDPIPITQISHPEGQNYNYLGFNPDAYLESTIPPIAVVDNKRVRNIIDFYLNRKRDQLEKGIKRTGRYFPMLAKILEEEGVPPNLIYLAGVESNYYVGAISKANAVGMWQFMRTTGLSYNLKSNQWIDERYNIESSTRAAARYLKHLHKRFKSWELALAAYNAGQGRVYSAIKKAKRRGKKTDYWSIINYLPRETRGYVPAFMALNIIFSDLKAFGFSDIEYSEPISQQKVIISTKYSPYEVAQRLKLPYKEIKSLNRFLIRDLPPLTQKTYYLYIPEGHQEDLHQSLKKTPEPLFKKWKIQASRSYRSRTMIKLLQQHGDRFTIRVRRGESLWTIARRYRTTIAHLRAWNNLYGTSHLRVGRKIALYAPNWDFFQKLGEAQKKTQRKAKKAPKKRFTYQATYKISVFCSNPTPC